MRLKCWMQWGALAFVLVAGSACGSKYIKNDELYEDQPAFRIDKKAEIRDNTRNRKVLDVLARYRRALVEKDFGALKRLIAEDYYDNGGTTATTDDNYGREKVVASFERLANYAEDIEYKVTVKDLTYERNRAKLRYEYEYAYKYTVGEKPSWDAGVELNELEVVQKDGSWKIVSGL
ncbi:MAG: hypothetical protein ABEL76_15875 [Bradymonadaceae bacterium]